MAEYTVLTKRLNCDIKDQSERAVSKVAYAGKR